MIQIGCGGWNDASWRESFYPKTLPASRWIVVCDDVYELLRWHGVARRVR